jgi:hypothetical protein
MTEAEWLVCTNPFPMLEFFQGRASERKMRLFACACCRQVWHLLADERSRCAVEAAERFAEGEATPEELHAAAVTAWCALSGTNSLAPWSVAYLTDGRLSPARLAWITAWCTAAGDASFIERANARHASYVGYDIALAESEGHGDAVIPWDDHVTRCKSLVDGEATLRGLKSQAILLRDIFGNTFCAAALDERWLTWNGGVTPKLAEAIYEERAFDRLPVLADALEDAGCAEPAILEHCRSGGEHVRGCWVVDLVLGKRLGWGGWS